MRKILTSLALVATSLAFAQVSIAPGEVTPKATLDIEAIGGNTADGILIPRVSRDRAWRMQNIEESTLIYVKQINGEKSGKTSDIDAKGFYYFKGGKWVKLEGGAGAGTDTNIYNTDGSLEGNRVITQNNHDLTFTTGTGDFIINGTSRLKGGSYVNTTIVNSGTKYTVSDSDYYISVSSNASPGQFNVYIPAASEDNKGRVLIISNRTGNANLKLLVAPDTQEQIISGSESEVISTNKAEWIVSDGTKWFNLINY